jgi:serine/threonine protein kinase
MSPEQINHDVCDARSDLFSLGSVLYAMCTGHAPFRAESVFAVLQRIVHNEPRPVHEANPNVPAWLAAFIGRLMAKDREARFQSATQVAELLEQELAHLQNPGHVPVPLRPWMPRGRVASAGQWIKQPSAAIGVATMCVLVAAAFAWRSWSLNTPALSPAPASGNAAASDASASTSASMSSSATASGPASVTPALPARPAYEPPTVPLWNADGIAIVQQYADFLEDGGALAPSESVDSWSAEVQWLQRSVEALLDEIPETSVPSETK